MSQEDYIKQLEMTVASLHKCLEYSNKDLDESNRIIAEQSEAIVKLHKRITTLESDAQRSRAQIIGFKAEEMATFPDYEPADRIAKQFEKILFEKNKKGLA